SPTCGTWKAASTPGRRKSTRRCRATDRPVARCATAPPLRGGAESLPRLRDRARPSGHARVTESFHQTLPPLAGEGGRRPEGGAFCITATKRFDRGVRPPSPLRGASPASGGSKNSRRLMGSPAWSFPRKRGSKSSRRLMGSPAWNFPRRRGKRDVVVIRTHRQDEPPPQAGEAARKS